MVAVSARFGQSFRDICVLIGSKCVDVIRGRIVIRLRVSAKAGSVGFARFANDYKLGRCRSRSVGRKQ